MTHFKSPATPLAPVAEKVAHESEWHGQPISDPYHWLRASNWQQAVREPSLLAPDIRDYLEAENQYCDVVLRDTRELQKTLIAEMRGRLKEDETEIPENDGPFAYYWRYRQGEEHPVFARVPRIEHDFLNVDRDSEELLLDAHLLSQQHEYFELGDGEVSPDHKLFAWSCDITGSEYCTLFIRDIARGTDLDYQIEDVDLVTWATPDILFYTKIDDSHRASRIYRHAVGSDPKQDVLVMQEDDPRFELSVSLSRTGAYIEIGSGTDDQDESWLLSTADPTAEPVLVAPRAAGFEYSIDLQGENLVILTNSDGATDFKIMTAPLATPQQEHWRELVAHKPGRLLLGVDCFKDYLVWMEREEALPKIVIRFNDGRSREIAFDEEAYSLGISLSPEYDSRQIRFIYSSPTTPSQWYDYDPFSAKRTLLKETEIPSGHQSSDYITRRLRVAARDGQTVPVTCLYHRDTPIDGTAPCLLYGYGSYGSSMPASFSTSRLSLVDRGFVFAIAHVRGGEEKGRDWYLTTKGRGKQQTFNDFIDCATHLQNEGYSSKNGMVCMGGSAGGLLIGSVINQAPQLFAGAIARVPFVDVLNTMLDDTLPLTPGEWAQWGNPIEDPDAFDWIQAYSPYDQVSAQDYPAMLVTGSVSDPRVGYWEPAKWVARLRVLKTDDNALLLNTRMAAGHFGKSGRFGGLEDQALAYAFAIKAVGATARVNVTD